LMVLENSVGFTCAKRLVQQNCKLSGLIKDYWDIA